VAELTGNQCGGCLELPPLEVAQLLGDPEDVITCAGASSCAEPDGSTDGEAGSGSVLA
jgi:hypothetical protein